MKVGVPKEIKPQEYRVGLAPAAVRALTTRGHQVLVEVGAGAAIGFDDAAYRAAGAQVLDSPGAVFDEAELIVKVKEPQPPERARLRPDHTLFSYLHLAPDVAQTRDLLASGACCIAYETVTDAAGHLPLLAPMSEVAGRLAVQAGAHCLEMAQGGRGVLLGGVPGVAPARVVVIGAGVVGRNALAMAVGLGADVTVLDRDLAVLRRLDERLGNRIRTLAASEQNLEEAVLAADLVIGAVLIPGARAPRLIGRDLVARMRRGAVLVDVAIDQGGCFETSRPTTHEAPTFVVDGVVHYCVTNMPGAVAATATQALGNATLPFVLALADKGVPRALREDPHLLEGLAVARGRICRPEVAAAQGADWVPALEVLDAP
jgi:alanine dehydrogenase